MVHPGKENVPLLMLLRRDRAAAGEGFVQQFNFGHALHCELAPVRQCAAAALTRKLIGEEVHSALLNAVILWLDDANLAVIEKPQQSLLMNGRQDALMNARIDCGRSRMPYYADWASHWFIISDLQPVDDTETRLY